MPRIGLDLNNNHAKTQNQKSTIKIKKRVKRNSKQFVHNKYYTCLVSRRPKILLLNCKLGE